ncbi:NAD(P)-dependent oxidoreductase [Candidatus Micrarchaeota archaeon]|nr:NAD(P)-dependent oxidoreductase [Candidatus Micrarchaeota archaeon]MBU2476712.1 NAD(P)-dependent oxidoreductase [Candidatus Micrarchaeota archaeon]
MIKCLVFGANGFAGKHLTDLLVSKGYKVFACTVIKQRALRLSKKAIIVEGDITNLQRTKHLVKGIDYVFNLAAIAHIENCNRNPEEALQVNAIGAVNVAKACAESNARLLHVSTAAVYGRQPVNVKFTEETPTNVNDMYSASKLAGEQGVREIADKTRLDYVIARAFNHYGPGQDKYFFIPRVILNCLKKEKFSLKTPESIRDYTFVSDIVQGYLDLMEKGRNGEVYNLCTSNGLKCKEIVGLIIKMTGSSCEIEWDHNVEDRMPYFVGSYDKAKRELSWNPKTNITEGLHETINYLQGKTNQDFDG